MSHDKLIQAAFDIREAGAADADELAFMARLLVQATLPHSDPGDVRDWGRRNGKVSLTITSGVKQQEGGEFETVGMPYGSYPRLVMAWLTSEAVRTRSRRVELGDSLSAFMRELDITPTGGRWGTITRLREQMKRLFSARIAAVYEDEQSFRQSTMDVASDVNLWWDPKQPEQAAIFGSTVTLGEHFFQEIIRRPVPLDMRALRALKKSPLGLDLYTWLTYRLSYLEEPTAIPWRSLHEQFGADYKRVRNFTQKVKRELKKIEAVWPSLRYETPRGRLKLFPCGPHVAKDPSRQKQLPFRKDEDGG